MNKNKRKIIMSESRWIENKANRDCSYYFLCLFFNLFVFISWFSLWNFSFLFMLIFKFFWVKAYQNESFIRDIFIKVLAMLLFRRIWIRYHVKKERMKQNATISLLILFWTFILFSLLSLFVSFKLNIKSLYYLHVLLLIC